MVELTKRLDYECDATCSWMSSAGGKLVTHEEAEEMCDRALYGESFFREMYEDIKVGLRRVRDYFYSPR
ncbi:hypothetical protein HYW76_01555 [Candidatus Pacearchaeota archaeon]|nr:hypothetical protein [Candidatus Pacearchaeota archaeon]